MVTALEGLRVVDFSRGFPGALATMVLCDNGAEVIHVEPPTGDPDRAQPAFRMWRRGQKSVTLDLHSEQGRAGARQLAAGADVVLQNWRPGVAEALGLDYETLARENPGLVHCGITGFGRKGKYANVKAYEGVVAARAGRFTKPGAPFGLGGRQAPLFLGSNHASYGAAETALQGIFAALYVRGRTGRGQKVETSLVQGLTVFDIQGWIIEYFADEAPERAQAYTDYIDGIPMSPYFYWLLVARAKDGRWFQFANVMPHLWQAFIKATELEHIYADPDFKTAPIFQDPAVASRFWDVLQDRIAQKTSAEWMDIFLTDPNIAAEILRTTQDAKNHPQMAINGHVVDVTDPDLGPMQQIGPQVILWETPACIRAGAPAPGKHNLLLDAPRKAHPAAQPAELPRHALEGVTILDIGTWFAAPFGPTLLSELGARVIKIEQTDGDPYRYGMPTPELFSLKALQGKESIAVDFRTEEGRQIVYELAKTADMAMCSFRQGVAAQFGVDYESLRKVNPQIIYHHGVSYGLEGEFPKRPVFGPIPPSITGEPMFQVGAGNIPPADGPITREQYRDTVLKIHATQAGLGDAMGALGVGTGMLLALVARQRTGKGQQAMTTMIGSAAYMMSDDFLWYDGKPERQQPDKDLNGFGPLYRLYQCAQGWVFLAAPDPADWDAFAAAVRDATAAGVDLAADARFADAGAREANAAALAAVLEELFRQESALAWEDVFLPRDIACVEVNETTISRFMLRDPGMIENGFVTWEDHFSLGRHPRHGLTVDLSATPGVIKPAPGVGEHTVPILKDLGYNDDDIRRLAASRVIRVGGRVAATREWEPAS